jgi:hypothetical protein
MVGADDAKELLTAISLGSGVRANQRLARRRDRVAGFEEDRCQLETEYLMYESNLSLSVKAFLNPSSPERLPKMVDCQNRSGNQRSPEATVTFKRKAEPKGPLAVFGYDYFTDHAKPAGVATLKLFGFEGLWGGGEEYAYEVLNFADGKKNAQEIRDAVSAEYGPVPVEMVVEYLRALEKIGLVAEVK